VRTEEGRQGSRFIAATCVIVQCHVLFLEKETACWQVEWTKKREGKRQRLLPEVLMMSNYSRPTRLEYTASIPLVCLEMRSVRCPGVTVLKTNACGNVTCFGFSPSCLATLCIAVRYLSSMRIAVARIPCTRSIQQNTPRMYSEVSWGCLPG